MTRAGNVLVSAVGALGVVSLLATGCSSDEAVPATTIAEPTVVEATSPPAITDPSATDPSTTVSPTTTVDPAATLAAEVEADFLEAFRLTDLAIQDPTNDDLVAAALDRYVESNRVVIETQIEELRMNGWVARPNSTKPAQVIVESPAVPNGNDDSSVVIRVCHIDSWIIVEPGAGPNGGDAVVNSEIASYRTDYVMVLVDGQWRVQGGESLGTWPETTCAAA